MSDVRRVAFAAACFMLAAFVLDAFTPQSLMIALLLAFPVAVAAFTRSKKLTWSLAAAAILLNLAAAVINAARDGFRWDVLALEDRGLTMLSIVLAGALTALAQTRAANVRLVRELLQQNSVIAERQWVISDMVDAIAHDLRTPLTALSLTLGQAAEGAFGALPSTYLDVLRDSRISIDDLQRLAETLLLIARYEAPAARELRDSVGIEDCVRGILTELRPMAQVRDTCLTNSFDVGTRRVLASRSDLRRAIANLVSNSITHTPHGGHIHVAVGVVGDWVDVEVSDDGFGVEPHLQATLFERRSRGSEGGSGSGLGLYIVRRIAEDAGGTIYYTPRSPHGSIFTLRLPVGA